MKSNNERRHHRRFKYEAFISHDVTSNDTIHPGKIFNFSKGGLYFQSDESVKPGEELFVGLMADSDSAEHDTQLLFEVRIVWRQALKDAPYRFGYGSRFLSSSDAFLENPDLLKLEQQTQTSAGSQLAADKDSRRYRRRFYNKRLYFIYKNLKFIAWIANISRGGALIETEVKFSLGESIKLIVPVDKSGKAAQIKGWIVRICPGRVGVSFERRSGHERRSDLDRRTGLERRGSKRRKFDASHAPGR